jgi:LytS/YehU family sensor histidine kinase
MATKYLKVDIYFYIYLLFITIFSISSQYVFKGIHLKKNNNKHYSLLVLGLTLYTLTGVCVYNILKYGNIIILNVIWHLVYFIILFLMGYFLNLSKFVLLWTLTYHLFQYWERSLIAEKEKYQLQAAAKENEYLNLKNQLNPHFLFNSLNSIRTLVDAEPRLAKSAINQLSSLLRSSLQTGKQKTISLKDELQTVKDYLAIECIRFDDRLKYTFNLNNEVMDCHVPPMMLQTLVENCVKHGISNLKNGGEIILEAHIVKNELQISIINSGQYIPAHNHEGVGLTNTRERLKILYDEKATITIDNKNSNHVETKITIPL